METIPVTNIEQIEEIVKFIKENDVVAYDYETYEVENTFRNNKYDGIEPPLKLRYPIDIHNSRIAGVGYGFENVGYYVPVNHKECKNFDYETINYINSFLKDKTIVCHNAKFEYKISKVNNIFFPMENVEDTMLMAHEFCTEWKVNLKNLAVAVFDIEYTDGALAKKYKMNELTLDQVYEYGCYDVIITWNLYKYFTENLSPQSLQHYREIELPIVEVIAEMEMNGVNVDVEKCIKNKHLVDKKLEEYNAEIERIVGRSININSPKQMREVLYDDLGHHYYKISNRTHQPSCDADTLKHFAYDGCEFSQAVLKARKVKTLNSFFFNKMPYLIHGDTKRLHASFGQAVTATGRFNSFDPNLQQLSKTAVEEVSVRELFLPDSSDELIVSLDLAGIELRLCAFMTRDETMLNAFKNDMDLHTVTTKNVFGSDIVQHKDFKKYRKVGKIMNFLILYGGSAVALKSVLGEEYSQQECEGLIQSWYDTYSGIKSKQEEISLELFNNRVIRSLFGRARTFYNVDFTIPRYQSEAVREAFNHLIQGSCGDMLKIIMLRIFYRYPELFNKMRITIHDELVFSLNKKTLFDDVKKLHSCFTEWEDIDIPIYSSVSVGENFGNLKDFETDAGDADFYKLREYCNNL
jgi:DNA polymerase-1